MDRWEFCNFPEPCSLEEYNKAERLFIEATMGHPAVRAVYRLGGISAPGISDIDFVVVLDGSEKVIGNGTVCRSYMALDERSRYAVFHAPVALLTPELLSQFYWLLPTDGLRPVAGHSFEVVIPSKDHLHQLKILLLADFVRSVWPWEFLELRQGRKLNVRMTLLRLNSFRQSVDMCREVRKDPGFGEQYCSGLLSLRQDWFRTEGVARLKRLLELVEEAVSLGWQMVGKVVASLSELCPSPLPAGRTEVGAEITAEFANVNRYHVFADRWDSHLAETAFRSAFAKSGLRVHCLPTPIVWPLQEYARGNCLLSKRIRQNLHPDEARLPFLGDAISKRTYLMNQHFNFIESHRVRCGLILPNEFGMLEDGRWHSSGKRWIEALKTLYCWHLRKPFVSSCSRRAFLEASGT